MCYFIRVLLWKVGNVREWVFERWVNKEKKCWNDLMCCGLTRHLPSAWGLYREANSGLWATSTIRRLKMWHKSWIFCFCCRFQAAESFSATNSCFLWLMLSVDVIDFRKEHACWEIMMSCNYQNWIFYNEELTIFDKIYNKISLYTKREPSQK